MFIDQNGSRSDGIIDFLERMRIQEEEMEKQRKLLTYEAQLGSAMADLEKLRGTKRAPKFGLEKLLEKLTSMKDQIPKDDQE